MLAVSEGISTLAPLPDRAHEPILDFDELLQRSSSMDGPDLALADRREVMPLSGDSDAALLPIEDLPAIKDLIAARDQPAPRVEFPDSKVADVSSAPFHEVLRPEPQALTIDDLQSLLVWCAENKASDMFVGSGMAVRAKVEGRLAFLTRRKLDVHEVMSLISGVRPNAETTLLQGKYVDTRYDFKRDRDSRYGFRVCASRDMEENGGDNAIEITFRMLPLRIPTIDELGVERAIMDWAFPSKGLVLVCGPTGSGKSTLLASLLQYLLYNFERRVLTYEAPPEYRLVAVPNTRGMVRQAEVGVGVESFADGVRNALRRAPDVIMLGESRDAETIGMTIRAAETGHAVYSTVHTSEVETTLPRMADEFPIEARWSVIAKLVSVTRMIINQTLVQRMGGGRVALREYLVFEDAMRRKILSEGPERLQSNLRDAMDKSGFRMQRDAAIKYEQGLIDQVTFAAIKAGRYER